MTITPWSEVLTRVASLNDPNVPFSFSVDGNVIVGFWDVAKIRMLGIGNASAYDETYRLEFRPVDDGVYDWSDASARSERSVGFDGGGLGVSASKSWSKGKSIRKGGSFTIGLGGTSHGRPTNVAGYVIDTEAMKGPVIGLLEGAGWTQKKGFFSRLFG